MHSTSRLERRAMHSCHSFALALGASCSSLLLELVPPRIASELESQRKLDRARSADLIELAESARAGSRAAVESAVQHLRRFAKEYLRQISDRIREVRMVEQIEHFGAELKM